MGVSARGLNRPPCISTIKMIPSVVDNQKPDRRPTAGGGRPRTASARPIRILTSSAAQSMRAAAAASPSDAVFLSPYLTRATADYVIGAACPASTTVLTTFEAETFANGGSTISAFRTLMQMGFVLRALPKLHAKVVIAGDTIHLGSQNLTQGGTSNHEATVFLRSEPLVAHLRTKIQPWIDASYRITDEMLDDMERAIVPLIRQAADLQAACSALDQSIAAHAKRREESLRREIEKQEQAEQDRRAAAAYKDLQQTVRRCAIIGRPVPLKLERQERLNVWDDIYVAPTLRAPTSTNLLEWKDPVSGDTVTLTKRSRYLVVLPHSGRLGWCAWNATQLSRFGTELDATAPVHWREATWKLRLALNQDRATLSQWNIAVSLQLGPEVISTEIRFTLDDLKVVEPAPSMASPGDRLHSTLLQNMAADLRDKGSSLRNRVMDQIFGGFRYERNSQGQTPAAFCVGLPDNTLLRLHQLDGHRFFSIQRT